MLDAIKAWEWIIVAYVAGGLTGAAAWAWVKRRAARLKEQIGK